MLTQLYLQNFVIIEQLDLQFLNGLTVITGETGAGKSIIIDALSLVLGERINSNVVGMFGNKCEISACFSMEGISEGQAWLQENQLNDESNECLVRRVITNDGKSRQMINGHYCTLQQLRELVPFLIDIHSQNQHQLITKASYQRCLLDDFGTPPLLLSELKASYENWQRLNEEIDALKKQQDNFELQCELLEFQLKEFEKLNIQPGEYQQLDQEHKQLAHAEQHIQQCHKTLYLLTETETSSVQSALYTAVHNLGPLTIDNERIKAATELLNTMIVNLEEAIIEIRAFLNKIENNPERLEYIERRLSKLHEISRKHKVQPSEIPTRYLQLKNELRNLKEVNLHLLTLQAESEQAWHTYIVLAKKCHEVRQAVATQLGQIVSNTLNKLGMPSDTFKVQVEWQEKTPSNYGCDRIQYLISTHPGQPPQPLTKIASGGELSRIALAIYVATAQKSTTPILVFDEVDVGIGGGTAAVVGALLKSLGKNAQVLCITHLPQVAAYGDQHLSVIKRVVGDAIEMRISYLETEERVSEIARMLGGITVTKKTLAHAKELIVTS